MNIAFAFVVGCLVVLMVSAAPEYTHKYDNINLKEILNSERLLQNYHKCLMDRGTCTPEGKELRDVMNDAIANKCAECNEKQKDAVKEVVEFLIKNKPDLWEELKQKYDPEGKYKDSYAKAEEDARKTA